MNKSTLLRNLLNRSQVTRIIGAHNGLSAKIGEISGFDCIWSSGFEISTSYCLPDANILSMTECLQAADVINKSVNIPVIADCDSGFGDINNIIHLVKQYESRDIAAICIEDKQFPKTNSFIEDRQTLVSVEDFSTKILAANSAKKNKDFMIIARIEALIAGKGMKEALDRAYAYQKAGADAILIHSKLDNAREIFEFTNTFKSNIPIFIVPTTYYQIKSQDILNTNIKGIIYANHGIRAAANAMKETFSNILANDTSALIENKIASLSDIFKLQGMDMHNKNYEVYQSRAKQLLKQLHKGENAL